jgi:hypothetical protein
MLAPIGIMQQMEREISKFLWQGGKANTKKFHLINWTIVRSPNKNGGLILNIPYL